MNLLKKADRIIRLLLGFVFAYITLVPFYYFQPQSLEGTPSFSLIKYLPFVLIGSACCLWGLSAVSQVKSIARTPIDYYLGLYLIVSIASLYGAEHALTGMGKWIYYNITGGVMCLLVVQSCASWQVIRRAALFIASIAGIVVVYTFYFAVSGKEPLWDAVQRMYSHYHTRHRAMGPFGHTVATATFVMLLLPLALWSLSLLQRAWLKVGWGIICALFVPVVILTQTRATQLVTLMCCVLMMPWLKKLSPVLQRSSRGKLYCGLAVVALLGGGMMTSISPNGKVGTVFAELHERWRQILQTNSVTIRGDTKVYEYDSLLEYTERFRIAQYYTVGNILAEHPLLGVGFGTFTREFERYRYDENYMVREFPEHTTENMYLMFLAETGVLGLLSRLLLMAAVFIVILRAWLRMVDGVRRDLLWAYLVGHVCIVIHMLTWDIMNEPTMRMTYWLWTGLALGTVRSSAGSDGYLVETADETG